MKTGLGDVAPSLQRGPIELDQLGGREDPFSYRVPGSELRNVSPTGLERALGHRLASITTPLGDVTSWSFDDQGRTTRIDYPWSEAETFVYGADGEVDTQTLGDGTVLAFTHDAEGRETSRTSSDGFDRSTVYGPGSRIESVAGPTGTVTYGYDAAGRLTSIDTPAGDAVRTAVEYEYDTQGRTTAVEVVVGNSRYRTTYGYDGLGNLISMVDEGTAGTTTWTYDAMGRPETRTTPNGVMAAWTYDARNRVMSVTHTRTSDGVVLASRSYTRTLTGEPTSIDREDGSYVVVDYDEANRVAQEEHFDASDVTQTTIGYTYDADGNRATQTVDGVTETYSYSAGSQLNAIEVAGTTTATFGYDGAGRTTEIVRAGQNYTLRYDPDGNVVGIDDGGAPLAQYAFDGEGRRELVVHNGVERRFLVAPAMGDGFESPHAAVNAAGQLVARWVYAGEHAVMRVDADGSVTYFLRDTMGTVLGTADGAGGSTASFQYDAFGEDLVATGADAALSGDLLGETRLHGMWKDVSGLYFVRARSYDAVTGRFLSRDPFEGLQRRPEALIRYVFAVGSPHLYRDPSGLLALADQSSVGVILASNVGIAVPGLVALKALQGLESNGANSCREVFPGVPLCSFLSTFYPRLRFSSVSRAFRALERYTGSQLKKGKRAIADRGPCPGNSEHINVRYARRGSTKAGTILTCNCCEDSPDGPKKLERCAARTSSDSFL